MHRADWNSLGLTIVAEHHNDQAVVGYERPVGPAHMAGPVGVVSLPPFPSLTTAAALAPQAYGADVATAVA